MNDDLFIKSIEFKRDLVEDFNIYPFNIDLIKNFKSLELDTPVTFLIGENGIGKSTFIEALAVACGLNPEGGTQNFMFSTRETHSCLHSYIEIPTFQRRCQTKFFLRAESFYNVATEIDSLQVGGYGKRSLHSCSHGESFLQLIQNRFTENGLYILDEPEAALSPTRQMTLLCLIDELVKKGSQFIIATHSPILISYINGKILDLNENFSEVKYEDTEAYQVYKMYLDNPYGMQNKLFDEEID
ncbi:MAG: AAA family ATPase [Bacilli bacterium]|nr:AAA family ATPase [Bacilli bacterium]